MVLECDLEVKGENAGRGIDDLDDDPDFLRSRFIK